MGQSTGVEGASTLSNNRLYKGSIRDAATVFTRHIPNPTSHKRKTKKRRKKRKKRRA